ncbi:MAG: gamma-glutamyltransferase [Candidatus Neomarinimicrobiota bacterium]|nr:gamma-glutamyltransferase [Candidatus Neomarinimicrobiota bacterium]
MNHKIFKHLIIFILIYFSNLSCVRKAPVFGENGMVVSTSRHASQVGIDILKEGGNAVDAAVGVGFALAVTSSSNGNIGGGGFMVTRFSNGKTFTLDYREMAPAMAERNMYLDENGDIIKGKSRSTHFASGVPGSVDGLLKAWKDHGSGNISIERLLRPSINLAKNGFDLSDYEAERFNKNKERLSKHAETKRIFTRDDRKWKAGDIFYQSDLAETLERIVKNGRDGFYKGKTADLIVEEMKNVGGWITHKDLENYKSLYRDPIEGSFKNYDILSMGPPSSGGILLIHMLNMFDEIMKKSESLSIDLSYNSIDYIHILTEIERRAYADRAEHLADADFWDVPEGMLLSKDYAKERVSSIDLSKATLSSDISHGNSYIDQSEETTHYSIVDKEGNAVSVTTTINSGYGNGITITGAGFLMNNEMDDFSSKPGEPNMFGLLGNEANAIEPKKRPLSSMTPTIVLKDGQPFLILGTPGGSTIITTVLQNLLNVVIHGMDIREAVSSPRVHSQWMPDMVFHEQRGLSKRLIKKLTARGHEVKLRGNIGEANGIMIDDQGFWGGPDSRGENTAIGY